LSAKTFAQVKAASKHVDEIDPRREASTTRAERKVWPKLCDTSRRPIPTPTTSSSTTPFSPEQDPGINFTVSCKKLDRFKKVVVERDSFSVP